MTREAAARQNAVVVPHLKGRDLRALELFRDRVRAALGKALVALRFVSRRVLEAPADAAAPPRPPGGPLPEPPAELRLIALVERRDVWVEERIDEAAAGVALETGALVTAFVYTPDEWGSPLSRASRLHAEAASGEAVT